MPKTGPLADLLDSAGVTLIDVGARGSPRGDLAALSRFARLVAFEADATEAARLQTDWAERNPWRELTIFPCAIASGQSPVKLYLTRKAGWSSLLPPNPLLLDRYGGGGRRVTGTLGVPNLTLDEAAERYGFRDACFLKLDTQGTELDILRSGERLLDESLVGIQVETSFQQLYLNQPLFADVDSYVRGHGFGLFGLSRTLARRAGFRAELFSEREVVWAHCLYLREPEELAVRKDAALVLARWLGIVVAFHYFDIALMALDRGRAGDILRAAGGPALSQAVEQHAANVTRLYAERRPDDLEELGRAFVRD